MKNELRKTIILFFVLLLVIFCVECLLSIKKDKHIEALAIFISVFWKILLFSAFYFFYLRSQHKMRNKKNKIDGND